MMGAEEFLPDVGGGLAALRSASHDCHGCDLYRHATQTVFGEGDVGSWLLLVGEQPGDQEDLAGAPFVGPAGRVLDAALEVAEIARDEVYVTNVVKHFKWEARGQRRLHKTPSSREVAACRPWLDAEVEAVRPQIILCLGATAAKALLGSTFRVMTDHGQLRAGPGGAQIGATIHPSAVLRGQDEEARSHLRQLLIDDLVQAGRARHP